ncbi:NAD-dependent epimerase/dehydratase family protein [Gordonia sp. HNM0687]|uniref:NAD-dependent epimerase/dehydratase family protein n=1 Tax=Gordonia mangrovi TaxID=2665643 RepID=A0A6L7GNI7_9ACTN|nr:SDR family oxidoreductase [Gordonia mangrovi]MXP20285.1 NAD-dependent epimerase/dehydratase family protein [Gordonia mangrovi]UVF79113.1 SDR family oxidoreductase [Gordonia mangrovi]
MRILVTGHLGYLGSEMVPVLRARDHEVIGLDTDFYGSCDFHAVPVDAPMLPLDVRDVTVTDLAALDLDAVIHLAALSNDPLSDLDPQLTYDINLDGSVHLAEVAKQAGVRRFLFSSSCSLYGKGGDAALDENAAFHPVTPYGESKVRVEQALSAMADDTFSPVYLRNATAYGLSRRLRADIVVNNLVAHAATSGKVLLESDGTPWRPLVHVLDIADAFAAVLDAPAEAIHDQAFNVGRSGENYQVREIADIVADVVGDCAVGFGVNASPDIRDYQVDFTKIHRTLTGYRPRWTVRRGVEQLWAAYRHGGMTADMFAGPAYVRLREIQRLRAAGAMGADLRWSAA